MDSHIGFSLAILVCFVASPAAAGPFVADDPASVAGITVGKARIAGRFGEPNYRVRLDGDMSLLGFSNRFEASAMGEAKETRLIPQNYIPLVDLTSGT